MKKRQCLGYFPSRDRAARVSVTLATTALLLTDAVHAQQRDLTLDLESLNVRHTTGHYALAGTVSTPDLVEYGACLEYIYREYANGFKGLLNDQNDPAAGNAGPDQPQPSTPGEATPGDDHDENLFRVIILERQSEYEELTKAYFGTSAEHTAGLFVPSANVLFISDAQSRDETYGTLFHEAFHQFSHRHAPRMPTWLDEGLAEYYGTGSVQGGRIVFRSNRDHYRVLNWALNVKELIPMDQLMRESQAQFYSRDPIPSSTFDHRSLAYAQAYSLVAYILSDPKGPEHLRDYIRRIAAAKTQSNVEAATAASFPPDVLEKMTPKWLDSIRRSGT